jgi:hypothetical protein
LKPLAPRRTLENKCVIKENKILLAGVLVLYGANGEKSQTEVHTEGRTRKRVLAMRGGGKQWEH